MQDKRGRLVGVIASTAIAVSTFGFVGASAPIAAAVGPTSLAGVVTDATTGLPVAGVEVDVVVGSSLTPSANEIASVLTDETGSYSVVLAGLATAADPVTVDLVDPQGRFGVSYANPVSLVDDDTAFAPFAVSPGGSVSGTVSAPGGAAIAGSCVTVRDTTTALVAPSGIAGSCTGADGRYSLPTLAAGTYTLTIASPDAAVWNPIPAQQVTVVAGSAATADAVLLPVAPTSITGVVTELGSAAPLAGVTVTATTTDAAGSPQTLTANTDAAGAFTLPIAFLPGPDPFVVDVVDPSGAHHPALGITISVQAGYTEAIGVALQRSDTLPTTNLTLTGSPTVVIAGQPGTVEVQVANVGATAATDVVVSATLPLTVSVQAAPTPAGFTCEVAGQTVTCTAPTLGVQRTATIRIPVLPVAGNPFVFGFYSASVTTSSVETDTLDNSTFQFLAVQPEQADLWVTLDNRPLEVGVSAPIRFGVRNEGPAAARDAFAVVRLPAGVAVDRVDAVGWTCAIDGQEVGCSVPSLPASEQRTADVFVTPSALATALPISSSVGSATPDQAPWTNAVDETFDVVPVGSVDLQIGTRPFFGQVVAGRRQTVVFGVSNTGPASAVDVTVTAEVPASVRVDGVTSEAGAFDCAVVGQSVTCTAASLARGASDALRFDVTPLEGGGPFTLTASVASSSPEVGVRPNSSAFGPVDVVADVVDLTVVTSPQGLLGVGVPAVLSVLVSNFAPVPGADAVVTINVPSALTVGAVTPVATGVTCSVDGQVVTCRVAQVPSFGFQFVAARISVTPTDGGVYEVVSEVTSPSPESDPTNNRTSALVQVGAPGADLTVTASAFGQIDVGQEGVLSVAVGSNGPQAAQDVRVVIEVPEPFTPVAVDTPGWSCTIAAQIVSCTNPNVFPFLGTGFGLRYTSASAASGTAAVTVSSATSDPNPLDNVSSVTLVAVAPTVDLGLFASQGGRAVVGEPAHAFITVFNPSFAAARDVVVEVTVTGGRLDALSLFGFSCEVRADGSGRCAAPSVFQGQFSLLDATVVADLDATSVSVTGLITSSTPDPFEGNNSATAVLTAVPSGTADLAAQLLTTPSDFVLGVEQDIRIGVSNFGPGRVDTAVATLAVPAELQLVTVVADPGVTCATDAGVVTCTAPGLAPGGNAGARVTVLPVVETFFSGPIRVTASGATLDENPFNDAASLSVAVFRNEADLALSGAQPLAITAVGESVVLPLSVFNSGPARATDVSVVVTFPSSLAHVPTPGPFSCTEVGPGSLACDLPDLSRFESRTVSVQFQALEVSDAASVSAAVSSAVPDPFSGNDTTSTSYRIAPAGAVDLAAAAPQVFGVVVGQPVTVAVTARHLGPSSAPAEDVRLVATFPSAVRVERVEPSFLFPGAVCTVDAGAAVCDVPALPASFEFAASVTLTPVSPAPFPSIRVAVSSSNVDPVPENDEAVGFIEVLPNTSDLGVSASGPVSLEVGAAAFVNANVFNSGFAPATGSTLRIQPEPGLTITSATVFGAAGACVSDAGAWSCPLGDLGRFGQLFASIEVTGTTAGRAAVTLSVSAANDANADNDTAVVPIEVVPTGTSDLFVDLGTSTFGADGRQLVQVSFGQSGPSSVVDAAEVRIETPALQPGPLFTFGADMVCTTEPEAVVCDVRQIGRFTRGVVSFEAVPVRDLSGAEMLATITGTGTDPVASNNTARSGPYDARITPSAPTGVVAFPADGAVELVWQPPAFPGSGVTGYVVEQSTDGGTTWTVPTDVQRLADNNVFIRGLRNGVAHLFRVAAVTAEGRGDRSEPSAPVTPSAPPRAPTDLSARAGNGQVTLTWRAPTQRNRNPIVDYVIEYSTDRGRTWTLFEDATSTSTRAVVTGLVNGTRYTFRVAGISDVGRGRFSEPSNAVTPRAR